MLKVDATIGGCEMAAAKLHFRLQIAFYLLPRPAHCANWLLSQLESFVAGTRWVALLRVDAPADLSLLAKYDLDKPHLGGSHVTKDTPENLVHKKDSFLDSLSKLSLRAMQLSPHN